MTETIDYFISLPWLELTGMLLALLYVVLAAKGSIWCWPAAFISTIIYTIIFYDVYLWMESLLQVYYMIMAVYGWYCWQKQQEQVNEHPQSQLVSGITQWSLNSHLKIIVMLAFISVGVGWFMANYTPAHFPYFDAATTVYAVFATYLVAKKVLENWLYWLVIDFASIYLYVQKDLTPTAVLFALYVVLALYGYIQWQKAYKLQGQSQAI
ncbi:nicotinamide riboside transporter PnuC [Colwelliaceae bacterium 6471]